MSLTAAEQYLLELINRARLDPQAEADRYGVGLNAGLEAGTISTAPVQVFAQNDLLSTAAAEHSAWMLQADTFSHTGRGGSSAGERMADANYEFTGAWSWRENLAWAGTTGTIDLTDAVIDHHEGLYRSSGHRVNTFASEVTEIGIGQVQGSFTHNGEQYDSSMLIENFATSGNNHFVTGVAYCDADGDAFYSIGEGKADVSFTSAGTQENTASAGGYSLNVGSLSNVQVTVGQGGATLAVLNVDLSDGNAKVDLVTATDGSRYLNLSADTDMISGVTDAQLLGASDIMLRGTDDRNVLIGNSGNNRMYGEEGSDVIYGGAGADRIAAGDGWDRVGAGSGDDQIWGGLGRDVIWGSAGEDILRGGAHADSLHGGNDDDMLFGNQADDRMYGGLGNDKMWGGTGNDAMQGGLGADYLHGGMGADALYGYTGNDRLNGGLGHDMLTGGDGADIFVFTSGKDQVMDFENNVDTISIFQQVAGAGMTKADVLALGEIVNGDAVFDFGDGHVLTVHDVAVIGLLENDLNIL